MYILYIILGSCLPVPQKLEVVHRAIDDNYDLAEADALRGRFHRETLVIELVEAF